jgi:hypothetical protein
VPGTFGEHALSAASSSNLASTEQIREATAHCQAGYIATGGAVRVVTRTPNADGTFTEVVVPRPVGSQLLETGYYGTATVPGLLFNSSVGGFVVSRVQVDVRCVEV